MRYFLEALKNKYKKSPRAIRMLLIPIYRSYQYFIRTYNSLRPHVWLIRGNNESNGSFISLMYCGDFREKNYFIRVALSGQCSQTELGRIWIWSINNFIQNNKDSVDILIHDAPFRLYRGLKPRRCFCIPTWVQGDLDFSLIKFNSNSIIDDVKRIRKNGYVFEIMRNRIHLKRFYKEMYVPYATERYGEELELESFENFIHKPQRIETLLVKKGEMYASGINICYKNNIIILKLIGVNTIAKGLVRSGAIQALYYFLSVYLKNKKYKRIILGGSRALFRDGVLNFKKKWGLRLTNCQHSSVRVYLLRDTFGVRSFLTNNACIALEGKDLIAMVFVDKADRLTKEDIDNKASYLWPGLKRLVIYHFGNIEPKLYKSSKISNIILRSSEELITRN